MSVRARAIALGAFGAGILAASVISLGNRRVDRWERLGLDDAGEGGFVTLSDGARMHYISRGDSRRGEQTPIILIHGVMDSAAHWNKNITVLAARYPVWAIDLIGFGFSSRVTEPKYTLKYLARSVREFMDAQGIERACLVGHSLGGAVALEYAHDFPERVDKMVLIAPGTCLLPLRPRLGIARSWPRLPRAAIGYALPSQRALMLSWRNALGDPSRLDLGELSIRTRSRRVKGTADALVAMLASPHLSDLPDGLAKIKAPVLMVWGDKDRTVPLRHAKYHEEGLPNARVVILEGAGHIPQNEYPELVNTLILDFLG